MTDHFERTRHRRGRWGFSSMEALVSLGVLSTILSVAPSLLLHNQRLLGEQRLQRQSIEALTNRLDELADVTGEPLRAALQPTPVDGLFGASIRGELEPDGPGFRITLTLTRPAVGTDPHTMSLTGWSFPTQVKSVETGGSL